MVITRILIWREIRRNLREPIYIYIYMFVYLYIYIFIFIYLYIHIFIFFYISFSKIGKIGGVGAAMHIYIYILWGHSPYWTCSVARALVRRTSPSQSNTQRLTQGMKDMMNNTKDNNKGQNSTLPIYVLPPWNTFCHTTNTHTMSISIKKQLSNNLIN